MGGYARLHGLIRYDNVPMTRIAPQPREAVEPVKRRAFTPQQKAELLDRQTNRCASCGFFLWVMGAEYDHVLPLELGGEHSTANAQVLCPEIGRAHV